MQEHMNVEENQALDSTPFMLIVSILYSLIVRQFGILFVAPHHSYNAMFFGIKLFCSFFAIRKRILPYNYVSKPNNDIINTDSTTTNNKNNNTNDIHLCNTAIECYILKQTK